MDYMREQPDNAFNLAIVDPPYGIGMDWAKSKKSRYYEHRSSYKNDSIPNAEYFQHLQRISENQIIWGANYYTDFLPPSNNWIIWDKKRNVDKTFMSELEMAWSSFPVPARFYRQQWDGGKKGHDTGLKKIHPHQKPVMLYEWLLSKYANAGDKILDSHLGSGSNAIACNNLGFEMVGIELDEDYYNAACETIINEARQKRFFS
jgi:site-specific DNA-methyltransferase (adenine-specific)